MAESLTRAQVAAVAFGAFVAAGFYFHAKCLAAFGVDGVAAEISVGPFKGDTDIGMRRILDCLDTVAASVSASPASDMNISNHAPILYRCCDSRNVKIAQ